MFTYLYLYFIFYLINLCYKMIVPQFHVQWRLDWKLKYVYGHCYGLWSLFPLYPPEHNSKNNSCGFLGAFRGCGMGAFARNAWSITVILHGM